MAKFAYAVKFASADDFLSLGFHCISGGLDCCDVLLNDLLSDTRTQLPL